MSEMTFEKAVKDLEKITVALESGELRPSAQVYFAAKLQEQEGLHEYLSAHESSLTLADLRAERYYYI